MRRGAAAVVLAAVVATSLTGCRVSMVDLNPGWGTVSGPTYDVDAVFEDALNLPVNGEVKLAGTVVGVVEDVTTDDYQAVAHLRILDSVDLPVGTTAMLRQTAPLGELYVALYPPDRPAEDLLADGDVLGLRHTSNSATIEDMLASVSLLMTGGSIQDLKTIVEELNDALDEEGRPAKGVLRQLETVVGSLNRHRGDIDRIVRGLNRLSGKLAGQRATLERALVETTPVVESLAAQRGQISRLVRGVARLATISERVVTENHDAVATQLTALEPILDELLGQAGELGPLLRNLSGFSREMNRFIKGDYLSLDIHGAYLKEGLPGVDEPLPTVPGIGDIPWLSDLLGGLLGGAQ